MTKVSLLFLLAFLFGSWGFSQSLTPEVSSAAGDHFSGTNVQLSWTLGELMIETYSAPPVQLTQGFHQTNLTITAVDDFEKEWQVTVYPNPTRDWLTIEWKEISEPVDITLFDLSGKLLHSKKLTSQNRTEDLNLSAYPAGSYFLHLQNETNQTIKTFKILKIK